MENEAITALSNIGQDLMENKTFELKGTHNKVLWGLSAFFLLAGLGATIGFAWMLNFEMYTFVIMGVLAGLGVGLLTNAIIFRYRELIISSTGVSIKVLIQKISFEYSQLQKIEFGKDMYRRRKTVFHPIKGRKAILLLNGFVDENKHKIESNQIEHILIYYAKDLIEENK